MTAAVALLRGVNVGGRRKVPMADLRDVLEQLGHHEVATHLNSGNAVFVVDEARLRAATASTPPQSPPQSPPASPEACAIGSGSTWT